MRLAGTCSGMARGCCLDCSPENHITHLNNNTWNDFFVGRLGAFMYQQFPTLLAARMGVHSLKVLSVVFGITLFSFKPLSLLLCYRFARDKRYVLFPLLSLFRRDDEQ